MAAPRPALRLLLALAYGLAALPAQAGPFSAPPPKRRYVPPAPRASAPPPPASAVPDLRPRLTLSGLSGLRAPGDGGATCRSVCARSRYACEAQGDSCADAWVSCAKTCGDTAASGTSSLLPRR